MADKRKYILATFLEACSNSRHHHRWMDADTWAKVIAVQYNLSAAVKFSGADIAKAFQYGNGKIIHQQMELETGYSYDGTNNKITLFKRQHRQQGQQDRKKGNYYYAAPAGFNFSGENANNNKWFLSISYGEDLLNEKKTRGNTLHFSSEIEIVEIANETTTGKRKRSQPQIHSIGLNAKSFDMAVSQNPLSTPEVSSLEEDPQCPPLL